MKWAHLPVHGGIYDQHPALLDDFFYIFQQRAKKDAERERAAKVKAAKQNRQTGRRGRRR